MSEHRHPHTETKNVIHRISHAAGHLEAIKKMVEDGRDCGDVLRLLSTEIMKRLIDSMTPSQSF